MGSAKNKERKKAVAFAKSIGWLSAVYLTDWNNYAVYQSVASFTERLTLGFPDLILISSGECRLATLAERDDFMEYVYVNNIDIE